MKISVIGNLPEESDIFLSMINDFVQKHRVGSPVIISAGSVSTLHQIDKYAKGKGYDSIIMGNVFTLALLNADKVIVVWDGGDKKMEEVLALCKREKKPYMEIKTQ